MSRADESARSLQGSRTMRINFTGIGINLVTKRAARGIRFAGLPFPEGARRENFGEYGYRVRLFGPVWYGYWTRISR